MTRMTFRVWCNEMWYNQVERWTSKVPEYTAEEYFARYKWFLKREYQYAKKD